MLTIAAHHHFHSQIVRTFVHGPGWMGINGTLQNNCLPVCQHVLPLIQTWDPDARVAIGFISMANPPLFANPNSIEEFTFSFGLSELPSFHAWIFSGMDVIADYVGPKIFGVGQYISWFDQKDVSSNKVHYMPVLTDPAQVSKFIFALLCYRTRQQDSSFFSARVNSMMRVGKFHIIRANK